MNNEQAIHISASINEGQGMGQDRGRMRLNSGATDMEEDSPSESLASARNGGPSRRKSSQAKKGGGPRALYWCWTLNNYSVEDEEHIKNVSSKRPNVTYLCYGKEVASSGTPHLQGYIEFNKRVRLAELKRLIGSGVHAEPRYRSSTGAQASQYCKKDGDWVEFGKLAEIKSGDRTDITDVRAAIKAGEIRTLMDVMEKVNSMPAIRFAEKYLSLLAPTKRAKPYVYWFHGSTGTGKSREVYEYAQRMLASHGWNFWTGVNGQYKWFDGYHSQELAIFDDFRANSMQFAQLLRLCDRYPLRLEVKGGVVYWVPRIIVFTTCKPILESFPGLVDAGEDIGQLIRRVDREFDFNNGASGLAEFRSLITEHAVKDFSVDE